MERWVAFLRIQFAGVFRLTEFDQRRAPIGMLLDQRRRVADTATTATVSDANLITVRVAVVPFFTFDSTR
jgi:hypothetical protein